MKKTRVTKKCILCGKEFETKLSRISRKYCSNKCFCEHKKLLHSSIVSCEVCGKPFKSTNSNIKRGCGKYCSRACFFLSMTNSDKNPWFKADHSGDNNCSWKGGITPLHTMIRNSEQYIKWRKQIFERDNYTCQHCNKRGCILEAHHDSISFSKIFRTFLNKYNQFSPIEDKETLLRLSSKYPMFWNTTGVLTLCRKCHNITKRKNYDTITSIR